MISTSAWRKLAAVVFLLLAVVFPSDASAQLNPEPATPPSLMESTLTSPNPFEQTDFLNLHQQIRIAGFLTVLSLLPFLVVMMTSFTRLTIIFHFLRQALGTQQVPSGQIVTGLTLVLTAFIMQPVFQSINENALQPYMNNELADEPEVRLGVKGEDAILIERSWAPIREFLLHHTRESDLQLFLTMGHIELPLLDAVDIHRLDGDDTGSAYDLSAIPWYCLIPSFVLSELRVAFMMGFLLFMPFLVIDMIIASILMSMGMMMLPPVMISMPFKLLLFIMIDGWRLIIHQMVDGYFPVG
ncbi:Flagellar biosynthetic protein FliP [Chlamydiales bacterium SCGC AG-110-P3]|nr:Flagellar biosynthetic protein FliP [Chlamydiales bacterium SCGC AG-110-P3]